MLKTALGTADFADGADNEEAAEIASSTLDVISSVADTASVSVFIRVICG